MKKLILILSFIYIALTDNANAITHLNLSVLINMDKGRLEVSGTSSVPVALPNNMHKVTEFAYNWPLPAKQPAQNWRGGAFVSDQELYLPSGWHPESDEQITFNVTVNAPVVTVLPGRISEEKQTDTSYQATFSMDRPTDGIPLFSGPYKITELVAGPTRLRTYFYEGMDHLTEGYLDRSARYLQRFSDQIGLYPFDEFHIIAAPIPAGYGFAGLTYIGKRVLHLPFIKETSLGHEILHNYWGNGVTPDYASGNWAEGLTTYMADYITAERTSKDKAKEMRLSWLRDYTALPKDQDKPVIEFVSKHGAASQVIGYHKVAFIFHMLRQQLGDDAFFSGLRHFWKVHAFKTASWSDLENSFNQSSGQDLNDFFQQWTKGTGAPSFKNISARAKFYKGQGWHVTARVMQDKPTFKTRIPLAAGTRSAVIPTHITINGPMAQGQFWVSEQPVGLSLDPDFHIFRKLNPNEAPPILRDLMLASEVEVAISGSDKDIANQLATRFIEGKRLNNNGNRPTRPFLLIGQSEQVQATLKKWGLPPSPVTEKPDTSATVWAAKMASKLPYVVVAAQDDDSLKALLRPLPHYGKRSALIFKGGKAIYKTSFEAKVLSVPIH